MRPLEPRRPTPRAAIFASTALLMLIGCQPAPSLLPIDDRERPPQTSSVAGVETPVVSTGGLQANTKRYSWDDLQALEAQEAWAELSEHLEDLAPAERSKEWQALVERTALATLGDAGDRDLFFLAQRAGELARRYPSLKTSDRFRAAAGDAAVRAIGSCASDASQWARCPALVTLLEKVVRDPKKTVRAADAAVQGGHRQLAMALYRSSADYRAVCDSDQALTLAMEGRGKAPDTQFHEDAEAVLAACRKLRGQK